MTPKRDHSYVYGNFNHVMLNIGSWFYECDHVEIHRRDVTNAMKQRLITIIAHTLADGTVIPRYAYTAAGLVYMAENCCEETFGYLVKYLRREAKEQPMLAAHYANLFGECYLTSSASLPNV